MLSANFLSEHPDVFIKAEQHVTNIYKLLTDGILKQVEDTTNRTIADDYAAQLTDLNKSFAHKIRLDVDDIFIKAARMGKLNGG